MLIYYAKVETSIKRSVRIQQINSYPKGKDGQSRKSICSDDTHSASARVENLSLDGGLSQVTLQNDFKVSKGRQGNKRCSKEDWKNQWSKWIGETLRQKLNKTINAEGKTFPQTNNVNVSINNQTKNDRASDGLGNLDSYAARGLHNSHRLVQMASERDIEMGSSLPDVNDFKMGEGNRSHKKRRQKDTTVKSYNVGMVPFKSDQYRQRPKTYLDKEPKGHSTTRSMDTVAYRTPPQSSLKRTSSLTRAEAIETTRSRGMQKRNTSWVDPRGN